MHYKVAPTRHGIIIGEKLYVNQSEIKSLFVFNYQRISALQGFHAVLDVNSKSCFERKERHWYHWIHLWWNYDHREAKGPVGRECSVRHSWVQPQAWTRPSCWGSGGHSVTKVLLSPPPKKGSPATPSVIAADLLFWLPEYCDCLDGPAVVFFLALITEITFLLIFIINGF